MSKCSKTLYYKNLFCKNLWVKLAYIRALVMSAYKEINCLISQPKHYVLGNQKNRRNETVLLSTKIIG